MDLRHARKINQFFFAFSALFTFYCVFPSEAFAQNIKINYINTDNYPEIEAGFIATNSDGIKIYNSTVTDFQISENTYSNQILDVTNPMQDYQSVSIVLMIDISVSMQGRKLEIVKEGLLDFIDQIPLESSEIAIACFSDESYIYSDFTQNRNRLISALDKLKNINGTNFHTAFLDKEQGALAIGQNSRNKKVIIFITDGLGNTDADQVSEVAKQYGSTIFTLNIALPIPKDLVTITTQTGGQYFDRIRSKAHFRSAATAIFRQLNCTDYGTVKWLSKLDCSKTKPVQLKYKDALVEFEYDVPEDKIGKIDVNPSLIQFGSSKVGVEQSQGLRITPINIPLTIKSFETDSASVFKLLDNNFPLSLKAGETFNTKVRFLASESGLYESNIKISFEDCPESHVIVKAGGEEEIKLVFPKGGEIFTVGEDTSIIWEGVKRTQPVEMSYKLNQKDNWQIIDKASNLEYLWNLPNDTSSTVQVKLTPQKLIDENMEVTAIIEGSTYPFISYYFGHDGNTIITTDKNGYVKTWNTQTGKIISSLGGYKVNKAIILDKERWLLFLDNETFVWNNLTNRIVGRSLKFGKKVNTSFILPDGYELLIGGNVGVDAANNTRLWSGINSFKAFLVNQRDVKWASFTTDGTLAVTLNDKNIITVVKTDSSKTLQSFSFKDPVSEVIISPDGSKALIKLQKENCILDLLHLKEHCRLPKSQYNKFTSTGDFILMDDNIYNSKNGLKILNISYSKFYTISPLSRFVAYCRLDSVFLYDLYNQKSIFELPNKPLRMAHFDTDDSKVYLLTLNNTLEIYDTNTGSYLGEIGGFSRRIRDISFNPVKHQMALLMEDNRLEVWSPSTIISMKDAVSGNFTIASPKPSVIDTIQFNEQAINALVEQNINKFAWNSTSFPIKIKRIEIIGKDASDFEVASKTFPQKIDAKSQLSQEFRFIPAQVGKREAIVRTYTVTDTFNTVIVGNGIRQNVVPIFRHFDFGKVKVGTYKDTLAPILVNIGTDTLIIRDVKNTGPDNAQFMVLSNPVYRLSQNDTLKVKLRFKPLTRGKTTSALSLSPESNSNRIIIRGEGIAPREIIISGITRNIADSIPIKAIVKKIDLGADNYKEEVTTGSDGKFAFKLSADRNFGIVADKQGFISTSLNIDLTEKVVNDTINQDIYLTEIKPGAIIRFNCIFFEFDKATLLPGSQSDLKRLLELIQKYKFNTFEIHGHTDSKGTDTYNMNLAKVRATTVMNYLIRNGASKDKLSIRFFGENSPVATNSTEEGRALNRRVELKVVN